MEENSGSPLFADRYRFEPLSDDWDTGRTGFTHPAFDIQENRRVVIKRGDVTSPQSDQHEHSLLNEGKALRKLKGLGVPDIYEESKAVYGTHEFPYLVTEYIEGIRVEQEISSLSAIERALILAELFRLLAKAHHRGIANGDIDLKHLFWMQEKQQLVIIDWGNASITSTPRNHQIAFDLARSAEIIYALVTHKGTIPVTGPLTLPEKEKLFPGLFPLPEKFYKLCAWAPRNPSEDMHCPCTALELFDSARKWLSQLNPESQLDDTELDHVISSHPSSAQLQGWKAIVIAIFAIIIIAEIIISSNNLLFGNRITETAPVSTSTTGIGITSSPAEVTGMPTLINSLTPSIEAVIPSAPAVTPSPKSYIQTISFDSSLSSDFSQNSCLKNVLSSNSFNRRTYDGNWQFQTNKNQSLTASVQIDFSSCRSDHTSEAVGMNVWLQKLEPNTEFGIYIETTNNQRREYTIWVDPVDDTVYLKIRETNTEDMNYPQLAIKPKLVGKNVSLSPYYQLSVYMIVEVNNEGLDILHLSTGPGFVKQNAEDIDPNRITPLYNAVRPTMNNVKNIGLVGHGPDIQAILWPLIFWEYKTP